MHIIYLVLIIILYNISILKIIYNKEEKMTVGKVDKVDGAWIGSMVATGLGTVAAVVCLAVLKNQTDVQKILTVSGAGVAGVLFIGAAVQLYLRHRPTSEEAALQNPTYSEEAALQKPTYIEYLEDRNLWQPRADVPAHECTAANLYEWFY